MYQIMYKLDFSLFSEHFFEARYKKIPHPKVRKALVNKDKRRIYILRLLGLSDTT